MSLMLNVLALVATVIVAYMTAVQGTWSALKSLAACVVAGAVAFGLSGPLSGLFPASDAMWYESLCLWAVFSVVFMGLRTLGETLLKANPEFPKLATKVGGGAVGLAVGYLTVGVGLVVMQMLPVAPNVLGGYEPFRYSESSNTVRRADQLWLGWDRGALAFFGYVSAHSLGPGTGTLLERYGDQFPPEPYTAPPAEEAEAAGAEDEAAEAEAETEAPPRKKTAPDADDVLYTLWYRRWQYAARKTGVPQGPLPDTRVVERDVPGTPLGKRNTWATLEGVTYRFSRANEEPKLEGFEDRSAGANASYLLLDMQIQADGPFPQKVDTNQFALVGPGRTRIGDPFIHGRARERGGEKTAERRRNDVEMEARGLEFSFPENRTRGHFLMAGATLTFPDEKQVEILTFGFVVPGTVAQDELRLVVEPAKEAPAPPAPKDQGAGAAEGGAAE